jgi:hypothetical protein
MRWEVPLLAVRRSEHIDGAGRDELLEQADLGGVLTDPAGRLDDEQRLEFGQPTTSVLFGEVDSEVATVREQLDVPSRELSLPRARTGLELGFGQIANRSNQCASFVR